MNILDKLTEELKPGDVLVNGKEMWIVCSNDVMEHNKRVYYDFKVPFLLYKNGNLLSVGDTRPITEAVNMFKIGTVWSLGIHLQFGDLWFRENGTDNTEENCLPLHEYAL